MPDIQVPRSVEIAAGVVTALLSAFAIFLILMTFSWFGTPVTNWALGVWGPDGAAITRAHTRISALTTLDFRNFTAPDRAEIERGRLRANLFGFLPGLSWVSRLEAEEGFVALGGDPEDDEDDRSLAGWRRLIDELSARNLEVRFTRTGRTDTVILNRADGSLRTGSLALDASGAGTALTFEGNAKASSLSSLSGELRLRGDNFADFAWLAGFAAPDTPPYDAVAGLTIDGRIWTIDFRPETRIGDSDVYGPLVIGFGGETPLIDARLKSANLDFDDLGIVFGVPIGIGADETVSDEQVRAREQLDRSGRLIPDAEIDFTRLDAVDGTVTLDAAKVSDAIFDIRALKLDVEIDGRVVRAPQAELTFGQGSLSAYVTLDGSQSPAVTTAEGKLSGVPFSNLALGRYLKGTSDGQFKLEGRGNGFRDVAASLDGRLSVWSENADLLALAAEGAALDIGEALLLLDERAGDETYTAARCAAVSVRFDKGIGEMDPAVIDTEDSLVLVHGRVNMRQETLELSIRSEAKDASFGTLIGDIALGGTFRKPEISAISPEAILQVGIAAILGSVSGGLAALPFIEVGDAPDAPCAQVLARAQDLEG